MNINKIIKPQHGSIRPISPVHIGTGEDIDRFEFVIDGRILYRISLDKLYANEPIGNTNKLLKESLLDKKKKLLELDTLIKKYPRYRIVTAEGIIKESMLLKEHIKTKDRLFIPGSTIKGSILTAVINHVIEYTSNESIKYAEYFESIVPRSSSDEGSNKVNSFLKKLAILWLKHKDKLVDTVPEPERIMKGMRDEQFLPWLQISDTDTVSTEKSGVVRIISRKGGKGAPPDMLIESFFHPKTKLNFSLQQQPFLNINLKEILTIVDKHYRKLFNEEKRWLSDNSFKNYINLGDNSDEYLIRVGYGSGNMSSTILPSLKMIDSYRDIESQISKLEAKTKWLAAFENKQKKISGYYPLGWALISLV